LKRSLENK